MHSVVQLVADAFLNVEPVEIVVQQRLQRIREVVRLIAYSIFLEVISYVVIML